MKTIMMMLAVLFVSSSFGMIGLYTYKDRCQWLGISTEKPTAISEEEWLKKGFDNLRAKANNGNANLQFKVGMCYSHKVGVELNPIEAEKWLLLAAKQGYADAQYFLGKLLLYDDSRFSEAYDWIEKAADQNHSLAKQWMSAGKNIDPEEVQNSYDSFYEETILSLQKEYEEFSDPKLKEAYSGKMYSTEQIKLEAEGGDPWAQNVLGVRYGNGDRVLENYIEAYAWFLIATMNGNENGSKNKDELKKQLSQSQISAGQQRAKELLSLIERNKAIAESDTDKPLTSEIAPAGFGSGLLIKGGYILTCWHVVDGAERISVSYAGKDHVASIVQKDTATDVAILKLNDTADGISLNFSEEPKLGEKIFTLGYPHPDLQGSDVKFTAGSISSMTGIDNSPRYFQISAPLQSGNSGGPLFDEQGNLVGIVAATLNSLATLELTGDLPQNVNYAIKADYLAPVLKTVEGLEIENEKTAKVNLLELIEELKKSAVMIKIY